MQNQTKASHDLRLVVIFRADLLDAETQLFLTAALERESQTLAARGGERWGCRYSTVPDFQLTSLMPAELAFAAALSWTVERWGNHTFYVDLEHRTWKDITQRRLAETRALLADFSDKLSYQTWLLRGEAISEAELASELSKWKVATGEAFRQTLEQLRRQLQGAAGWALVDEESYAAQGTRHLAPGAKILGVYPSADAAEEAARASGGSCYLLNAVTGETIGRWYGR